MDPTDVKPHGGGLTNLEEFSTPYYLPSTYEEKEVQDHQASRGTAVFRAKPQHNLMSSLSKVQTAPLNLMRSDSINPSSLMLRESSLARAGPVPPDLDVMRDTVIEPRQRMESP
jgi:hypothetical protein